MARHIRNPTLRQLLTNGMTRASPRRIKASVSNAMRSRNAKGQVVFLQPVKKASCRAVVRVTVPNHSFESTISQRFALRCTDVKKITKHSIRLDTATNCFPKAIVIVLLKQIMKAHKAGRAIAYPVEILGPDTGIELSKLIDAVRKNADSRGWVGSAFQRMVKHIMEQAGLSDAFERGSCNDEDMTAMKRFLKQFKYILVV